MPTQITLRDQNRACRRFSGVSTLIPHPNFSVIDCTRDRAPLSDDARQPHISGMNLDLTDDEKAAPIKELDRIIRFYAQGSVSFVAGAALGNAIGTAANQVATYRDCMMATGYTPRAANAEGDDTASGPPGHCGGGPGVPCTPH